MATIQQYVNILVQRETLVARRLGVDLGWSDKSTRVVNRCMLILTAVLVKAMVDKGLVTDAEMLDLLDSAGATAWADLPWPPDGNI